MRTQCELLGVARSSLNYVPVGESAGNVKIKRLLDELYLRDPCLGSRRLVTVLERNHGIEVNRKRLQRLRREMGLEAAYQLAGQTMALNMMDADAQEGAQAFAEKRLPAWRHQS